MRGCLARNAFVLTGSCTLRDELAGKIAAADGYIMVSPEYNHSMSPALAHRLNHFGSYAAGQWGRTRAEAAGSHRRASDPRKRVTAFKRYPLQRNAP